MNKHNLIKLGALAQKKFGMKDDFKIIEVPSDSPNTYRVAIPHPVEWNTPSVPLDIDSVTLEKFASTDNFESISCGYSARANVLIVKERANNA